MPGVRRNLTTPTLSAGPSTSRPVPYQFILLREMFYEDNIWESSSDMSTYSDYNYIVRDSDADSVVSSMLPIFTSGGGKKKPKQKKGNGKAMPAPKKITSQRVSPNPIQQQKRLVSKAASTNTDRLREMPLAVALAMAGTAVPKVIKEHCAKFCSKIDSMKTEVLTFKTSFASHVVENK